MTTVVLVLGVYVLVDAKKTLNRLGINVTARAMTWLWVLIIVDVIIEAASLIEVILNKWGDLP